LFDYFEKLQFEVPQNAVHEKPANLEELTLLKVRLWLVWECVRNRNFREFWYWAGVEFSSFWTGIPGGPGISGVARLKRAYVQGFQKGFLFPHRVRLGMHCTPCTPYCYAAASYFNFRTIRLCRLGFLFAISWPFLVSESRFFFKTCAATPIADLRHAGTLCRTPTGTYVNQLMCG